MNPHDTSPSGPQSAPQRPGGFRWKTPAGLVVLWAAVITEQIWIWGVLFLLWAALDLTARRSYFLEEIRRDRDPVVYWTIVLTWIAIGLYYLSALLHSPQ